MNPQAILCDEVFFIGAMALMQGAFFYKVIIVKTLGRPYWATLRLIRALRTIYPTPGSKTCPRTTLLQLRLHPLLLLLSGGSRRSTSAH
jgi:hypothetical protein